MHTMIEMVAGGGLLFSVPSKQPSTGEKRFVRDALRVGG